MSIFIQTISMPAENEFTHIRIYGNGEVTVEDAEGFEFVIGIASEKAPDAKPVVCCKDCQSFVGRSWDGNKTGICCRTDCGVGADDFCSYGRRRTNNA